MKHLTIEQRYVIAALHKRGLQQKEIATEIVFNVAKNCVQVIYWGDDLEFSQLKTMNYLSFNIFKYYKEQNISIIDIGPSTENSIPNYGLCEFKESIGCDISQKLTFELKL
jgi:lipid II:glycine glycyltransferase (peptidoglycan interpeptide bridge formation enzyme)